MIKTWQLFALCLVLMPTGAVLFSDAWEKIRVQKMIGVDKNYLLQLRSQQAIGLGLIVLAVLITHFG